MEMNRDKRELLDGAAAANGFVGSLWEILRPRPPRRVLRSTLPEYPGKRQRQVSGRSKTPWTSLYTYTEYFL